MRKVNINHFHFLDELDVELTIYICNAGFLPKIKKKTRKTIYVIIISSRKAQKFSSRAWVHQNSQFKILNVVYALQESFN